MRFPWLDTLLTLAILVGAFLVWRSATEHARLEPEYERLKLLTGELIPADPSKIYIRALKTDDPLEFAWRAYFPPNYRLVVRDGSGYSSGSNSNAVNGIVRVRIREVDGSLRIYQRFPNSSGLGSLPPELQKFLKDRWDRVEVEQIGREQVEELDVGSEFVLLRLKLPADLQEEAKAEVPEHILKQYSDSLLKFEVGPPNAQP